MADDLRDLFTSQRQRLLAAMQPEGQLLHCERSAATLRRVRDLGLVTGVSRTEPLRDALQRGDDGVAVAAANYIDAVAPALGGAIRRHFVPFARNAIDNWPVRTGTSKALMLPSLDVNDGTARMRLSNSAKYSYMIRWGKQSRAPGTRPGQNVWQTLAERPHREVVGAIAAAVEHQLAEATGGNVID
jgi:hypothetical protein